MYRIGLPTSRERETAAAGSIGGAARTRYRVKDATYVVVLVDGRIEYRMSPFEGGFTVTDLEPLAVRTTKLRTPAPLPPDGD